MARGLCLKPRDSFGIAKDSTPPATLHYDMWLGPVTWRQYNEKRAHYNWHWFWDTGNGDTGNQGPHEFDVARWGMNKNEHPVSVYSTGGIYGIDPRECAQETPNTQTSVFKYNDGKMIEFETRGRYTNDESSIGIRTGKDETLNCDIIDGYYSSVLPLLANISYRLGRELRFMGDSEKFVDDPEADTMLTRMYRKPYVVPENV